MKEMSKNYFKDKFKISYLGLLLGCLYSQVWNLSSKSIYLSLFENYQVYLMKSSIRLRKGEMEITNTII